MSLKLGYLKFLFFVLIILLISAWNDVGQAVRAQKSEFIEKDGLLYLQNSDKPYTGKYNELYENGNKKESGFYKNGKKDGKATLWYENGNKQVEFIYKNNLKNGKAIAHDKDGWKSGELNFKDDKLDGEVLVYYKSGKLKASAFFKNDIPNGKGIEYYENGNKKSENFMKNGQLTGKSIEWYENGDIKKVMFLKNGIIEGKLKTWYKNNKIEQIIHYKNGKVDGEYSFFYKDGNKKELSYYKNSKFHGKATFWYENGKKESEHSYKNGVLEGISTEWSKSGNKINTKNYKEGKLDGKFTEFDDSGKILFEIIYKDGKEVEKIFKPIKYTHFIALKTSITDINEQKTLDNNIKNYLNRINNQIKYKRINQDIKISANKKIIKKINKDLNKVHSFYFLEEGKKGLDISVDLIKNIKKIPDGIKIVKSSFTVVKTGKIENDYYFRTEDDSIENINKLKKFVEKLKIPKAYKICFSNVTYNNKKYIRTYILKEKSKFKAFFIKDIEVLVDPIGPSPYITLSFNEEGKEIFANLTERIKEYRLAIVIDGIINSAPIVLDKIPGGRASIIGNYGNTYQKTLENANTLAENLRLSTFINYVKIAKE